MSVVKTPSGSVGMVIEKHKTYSKVLSENGDIGVFDSAYLVPVNLTLTGMPTARGGSDKLSSLLDKIHKSHVGVDDFNGDVLIPFKKVRDLILNEIKMTQYLKTL